MRDTSAYYYAGTRLVSVTEALSICGLRSFEHVPPEVLEKARVRGQAVHEFLEMLDLGMVDADDASPEIAGYVGAYADFVDASQFSVMHCERVVRNEAHGYAGTLDRTGTFRGGKLAVVDIKCVAALDDVTGLQLAGYAEAIRDEGPLGRFAVQLRPDGSYRLERYESRQDLHDFIACVRVARWRLEHGLASLEDL